MLTLQSRQLFPGFQYDNSTLKACVLEGIHLKNGKHLANLGPWPSMWTAGEMLTVDRFNPPLRSSNCSHRIPLVEIRTKTGGGWTEVRCITSMAVVICADLVLREMQVFLVGYIIIEICEIFTVGGFPLSNKVRIVSSSFQSIWSQLTRVGLHWHTSRHDHCDFMDPHAQRGCRIPTT